MILELSRGAEKSGAGFADFVKLEGDWVEFMGGGHVRLPSDCADSLRMFLTYVVRERERSRSLPSLWRVIGSYQVRTFRANLTSDPRVKAHYSSLLDQHGVEEHPRTSATPRMLKLTVGDGMGRDTIVDKFCPRAFIADRTKLRTKPHPGPELPWARFACMCTYLVCGSVLYGVFCPPTLARALWRGERRGSTVGGAAESPWRGRLGCAWRCEATPWRLLG